MFCRTSPSVSSLGSQFPAWKRAHPSRFLAHNGEINTIKGNVNAMRARQALFRSNLFGDDLPKVMPIIDDDGSPASTITTDP